MPDLHGELSEALGSFGYAWGKVSLGVMGMNGWVQLVRGMGCVR